MPIKKTILPLIAISLSITIASAQECPPTHPYWADIVDLDSEDCSGEICLAYAEAVREASETAGVTEGFSLVSVSPLEVDTITQTLSERGYCSDAADLSSALQSLSEMEGKLFAREQVSDLLIQEVAVRRANLTRDVEIKLESDGGRVLWPIHVETVDSRNREKSNYWVRYVPVFWQGVEEKVREFPRLSSPTTHGLVRGSYLFWTAAQNDHQGEVKQREVRSEDTFVLPIPEREQ